MPADAHATAHAIGELCVSGDWACAHGDLSALRDVPGVSQPTCPSPCIAISWS